MSQTTEGVIRRVFDPDPGTNKPWNVFLEGDDRRFATFKKEIADVVRANIGNKGMLSYSESQRGQYTNYLVEGFEPMKTLDRELLDRGSNGAAPNYRQPTHPDEQASIHRAVALQRANEWLPYLTEPDDAKSEGQVPRALSSVFLIADQYVKWLEGNG